jgi:hypothetical protein
VVHGNEGSAGERRAREEDVGENTYCAFFPEVVPPCVVRAGGRGGKVGAQTVLVLRRHCVVERDVAR